MENLKALVEERLAELDLGPIEAAVQGGLERTYIRDILDDRKKSVRADKMPGLATALKMPVAELSRRLNKSVPGPAGLRKVTVKAHVQAGTWAETWEWEDDACYPIYIPDEPELRPFRLFAAETRGPSMNKRWPERTVVVFTDVQETLERPIAGKRYVVERRRLGGEAEHTVKLMHADASGKLWLMPESDDPRFQAPISIDDGLDGETIIVLGRVHFAVTRE